MKAYKVTILIVDHDDVGPGIKEAIESVRYPNRCIHPHVMGVEAVDIGEWRDDHPLNFFDRLEEEFKKLFPQQ